MDGQFRLMVLAKGVKYDQSVYRLRRGWQLSFACDPILQSENIRLFWNYPTNSSPASHSQYKELEWQKSSALSQGYEYITEAQTVIVAGTFLFFYTIDGSALKSNCDGFGYIIVNPNLTVGKDDKVLGMDAVQLHTVLPKLLGTFPEWRKRLLVSCKTGYNMIHFTPLQKLNGHSKSSYSISDQLQLNPAFSTPGFTCTRKHIRDLVRYMNDEWKVLSVTDMVYNHTANDSDWLVEHPESAYNLYNSAHLKPAYLIDRLIHYTSQKVASTELEHLHIPAELSNQEHIAALRDYLKAEIRLLNISEFYTVDVLAAVGSLTLALQELLPALGNSAVQLSNRVTGAANLRIEQDNKYRRLQSTVNMRDVLRFYNSDILEMSTSHASADTIMSRIAADFQRQLTFLNDQKVTEVESHLEAAVENVIQGVVYRFTSDHGPKIPRVTSSAPLVHEYFINKRTGYQPLDTNADSVSIDDELQCKYIMAHNGWVMGDDPLKNFAEPSSLVYLKRELVVWGDSVKLRYGDTPADSAYLWQRMEDYTKQTVEIFHGVRLDNCHSTPIHVAEHMMRYARSIRPDLYVMAELFTSHEEIDNVFVNRLGLNSLIREGLSAWNAHEQGRLVYRYGGKPVGSFTQPNVQLLQPTVAHALLMDATHDNDSIVTKRTVNDSLSLSAYTAMACCATGSNRGYDELVPHHISVVDESRLYPSWHDGKDLTPGPGYCNINTGIVAAKLALNTLHQHMGDSGFDQVYVHDLSGDVVSITRHNPVSHKSFICVVRSAFNLEADSNPRCDDLIFEGRLDKVELHGTIERCGADEPEFIKHDEFLHGLLSHTTSLQTNVSVDKVSGVTWQQISSTKQQISFQHFSQGSVLIISVLPNEGLTSAQSEILNTVSIVHDLVQGRRLSEKGREVEKMMSRLTLLDLHVVMYHCEAEEKSITGYGSYVVPRHGALVYTGLQGIMSPMSRIRTTNDLGHALCQNIRDGDWLMEYITDRLALYDSLKPLAMFLSEWLNHLKELPRYLIPAYFDVILVALSILINHTVWSKMNRFVADGSPFVKELALCSQQFCGFMESAKLARLSPSVEETYRHLTSQSPGLVSISAGLPHFSEGLMRIWGRDTFISLRGLLLATGRASEARAIILSFAGTLRHGLMPNLLGEGVHARYNCRDAVWWWLQAIQDYCNMVSDGISILKDEVNRINPRDDCEPYSDGEMYQPLAEVIQEALQRHADGIRFREKNAGVTIDEHMTDEGFNVEAGIDWSTGFVYGGSEHNCGTWMDKMGSSARAGNKGKPATPRNGSAVELVGLCASTVSWLSHLHTRGFYPYDGVAAKRPGWSHTQVVTFKVWYGLIARHFESHFWVDGTNTSMSNEPRPDLINHRDIYKDSVGASPMWADYQLRPNFPIAMVVAPDLFATENALAALKVVEKHLVGRLGMKTLDRSDLTYNGDYVNSDDSENYGTARGFNYHNGPEWLWPMGYYMRAKLEMLKRSDCGTSSVVGKTIGQIENKLAVHHLAILSSDWRSLPELTNVDGKVCSDSCPAQAWSVSCVMDVLHDINGLRSNIVD